MRRLGDPIGPSGWFEESPDDSWGIYACIHGVQIFSAYGCTYGSTRGSTRGPRGPKNMTNASTAVALVVVTGYDPSHPCDSYSMWLPMPILCYIVLYFNLFCCLSFVYGFLLQILKRKPSDLGPCIKFWKWNKEFITIIAFPKWTSCFKELWWIIKYTWYVPLLHFCQLQSNGTIAGNAKNDRTFIRWNIT